MAQRGNIIYIKHDYHNWKRRRDHFTVLAAGYSRESDWYFIPCKQCFKWRDWWKLTLGSSVVCRSNALEPLLACGVPPLTHRERLMSIIRVTFFVLMRCIFRIRLTAAGWKEHPAPRSAPSQSQHRLLLCSSCQRYPCKTFKKKISTANICTYSRQQTTWFGQVTNSDRGAFTEKCYAYLHPYMHRDI